jgi:hypothetical protein
MDTTQILGPICSAIGDIPHTTISSIWFVIQYIFSHYWYILIPIIVIWSIAEIVGRFGSSDNSCTPVFNSFVGGGVFLISEKLIYFVLEHISGSGVHCGTLFLRSFYLLPFLTTGLFLHAIRFWPYWKIPFIRAKIKIF